MDILNKVKAWASALTEAGISLIALGVVLEVLFNGQNIPFWPNINIIANIPMNHRRIFRTRFTWFSSNLGIITYIH